MFDKLKFLFKFSFSSSFSINFNKFLYSIEFLAKIGTLLIISFKFSKNKLFSSINLSIIIIFFCLVSKSKFILFKTILLFFKFSKFSKKFFADFIQFSISQIWFKIKSNSLHLILENSFISLHNEFILLKFGFSLFSIILLISSCNALISSILFNKYSPSSEIYLKFFPVLYNEIISS